MLRSTALSAGYSWPDVCPAESWVLVAEAAYQRPGGAAFSLTAPGLTLKLTTVGRSPGGLPLRLALEVQRAAVFQNGPNTFTLRDAAEHRATFLLNVS